MVVVAYEQALHVEFLFSTSSINSREVSIDMVWSKCNMAQAANPVCASSCNFCALVVSNSGQ